LADRRRGHPAGRADVRFLCRGQAGRAPARAGDLESRLLPAGVAGGVRRISFAAAHRALPTRRLAARRRAMDGALREHGAPRAGGLLPPSRGRASPLLPVLRLALREPGVVLGPGLSRHLDRRLGGADGDLRLAVPLAPLRGALCACCDRGGRRPLRALLRLRAGNLGGRPGCELTERTGTDSIACDRALDAPAEDAKIPIDNPRRNV